MFDDHYIIVGTSVLTFIGGISLFFWRASWWLSAQFSKSRDLVYQQVNNLEDKFDKRHEDNIQRFAKIETKLDIVIKNGHS